MPAPAPGNAVNCQGIGGIAGAGTSDGISWAPAESVGSKLAAASSTASMRIRGDRIEETSGKTDTRIGQDYLLRRLTSPSGYVRSNPDVERRGVPSAPAPAAFGLANQPECTTASRATISPPTISPVGANPIRA